MLFLTLNVLCRVSQRKWAKVQRITNSILYMICKDNQPFSITEDEGFRNLMKVIVPNYALPSRDTLSRLLDSKFDALSSLLRLKLSSVQHIIMTTDIWADTMQTRSFLGLTAHFAEEFEFRSLALGVYQLNERHTAEYLAQRLIETCDEWGIKKENISAVVTDNAANITKAIGMAFSSSVHLPCFAHTLNLVVQQGIEKCTETNALISKIKSIVTWFKQSTVASDELRKSAKKEKKLIQEVPTRWNSKFYMLERFVELRAEVNNILNQHVSAPTMLSAIEMQIVSSSLEVLRPFEAATREVSSEKYATASRIIPLINCVAKKLSQMVLINTEAVKLKEVLLFELQKRAGKVENVRIIAISTLLDLSVCTLMIPWLVQEQFSKLKKR